jgi:hypothetical protein
MKTKPMLGYLMKLSEAQQDVQEGTFFHLVHNRKKFDYLENELKMIP